MSEHIDLEDCIHEVENHDWVCFKNTIDIADQWVCLEMFFERQGAPDWLIDMIRLWVEHKMSVADELRYKEAVAP